MPKRALIDHRPWLLASLAGSLSYYVLQDSQLGEFWLIPLKGSALAFLAIYALRRAPGVDAAIIALVLALAALADMALVLDFKLGGVIFALSHITAIALYLRNRRTVTSHTQKLLALALLLLTPAISYALSGDILIAVYGMSLGLMAATAWLSRFPRYRVGIGAVLFVVSDWLIFSQQGALDLGPIPEWTIWPVYYSAQFLIATGVVQTLRRDHEV